MEIELPDGTILDAPDDADVKTVVAGYNRQIQFKRTRQAARQTYADSSTGERFLAGVARPFVELGLGAKDLAGKVGIGEGLTEEDELNLARLQEVSGGAGTAGRIAGELATFALPGGAAGKVGTKLAAAAPRALKYAPAAADIATSAGMEALKAPAEDQSRADRAMGGAFGAAAGRTLLPLAGKAMRGVTPRPEAQEMLDAGIPLTAGMQRGGWLQGAEETLASMPIVGGKIRQRQQDALQAWNKNLLSKASPIGNVSAAGQEYARTERAIQQNL